MTEPTDRDDLQTGGATQPDPMDRTDLSVLPPDVQQLIKRLNDENAARRNENKSLQQQMQEQRDAELAEQERWKELAETRKSELDQLKGVQDHASELEQTLLAVLDAQLADLPTEAQKAIQDMPGTAKQKLDWLAVNRATLTRAPAPNMHAGPRGDELPPDVKLTPLEELIQPQSGISREAWIKRKQAKAGQEDRGQVPDFLARLRANNQE